MKRQLFDLGGAETGVIIWENPDRTKHRWHVMTVNYVAHFDTQAEAESFVEATKRCQGAGREAGQVSSSGGRKPHVIGPHGHSAQVVFSNSQQRVRMQSHLAPQIVQMWGLL